jgi:DNA invertase Pin-like site-specific DNA recombinase
MPKRSPTKDLDLAPKLKAYGYCRVSTEEQAREGISLDAQEQKIRAYAQLKDLELLEIIRDEGFSGKDIQRPGLQRLLNLIDGAETEALVVYKLDRLTRNTSDLLHLIEDIFKKGNTRFFSITEDIDTESAMGKFFLTIMGAMAQMERELISERTSTALQYKKSQGQSLGKIPFGYSRIDGKLVPNNTEKNIIQRIKRWRKNGLSYDKIANLLNEKGIKPKHQKSLWHGSTVHFLLNKNKK